MLDSAEALCPHVMRSGDLRKELRNVASSRMKVPQSFISSSLLEQAGVDLLNKIRSSYSCCIHTTFCWREKRTPWVTL